MSICTHSPGLSHLVQPLLTLSLTYLFLYIFSPLMGIYSTLLGTTAIKSKGWTDSKIHLTLII